MSRPDRSQPMDSEDLALPLETFARLEEPRGPSMREYQEALGLSSSSVAAYRVRQLVQQGWVEQLPPQDGASVTTRGYRLTPAGRAAAAQQQEGQA